MAWCVVRVKLPRHLPFTDGSAGCPRALSGGHSLESTPHHDPDREQTHISQALRYEGATLQQRGQVNHHGLTGFNPLNHEFTLTLLGWLNLYTDPISSVYISVLSPWLLFAPLMGLTPMTPI